MMIKASGRSALILAAGLFVCFAGCRKRRRARTATAKSETAAGASAESRKSIRHGARHWKK